MINMKMEGFEGLAAHFRDIAERVEKLDGTRVSLHCPQCGSTSLVVDDELGEDAPIRCENGHVLGLKKEAEALVQKQVEEQIESTLRG